MKLKFCGLEAVEFIKKKTQKYFKSLQLQSNFEKKK